MATIQEIFEEWTDEIRPGVIEQYSADDIPALSESWNDFTDMRCKDGALSPTLYHYCPAYDDDMPDDDLEFLLESLGIDITSQQQEDLKLAFEES